MDEIERLVNRSIEEQKRRRIEELAAQFMPGLIACRLPHRQCFEDAFELAELFVAYAGARKTIDSAVNGDDIKQ